MSNDRDFVNFPRLFNCNESQPLTSTPHRDKIQDADTRKFHQMIADEQMRNEEHRNNFLILKTEYESVLNQLNSLQAVHRQVMEEKEQYAEKYRRETQKLKKEIITKDVEIDKYKNKLIAPNIEILKLNIQEEVEKTYRERFAASEEEIEHLRMDCNKLKYDLAYVKADAEYNKASHQHVQEELTLKFQTEINALEEEKILLQKMLDDEINKHDSQKINLLSRTNVDLERRIRNLKSEISEIEASKEEAKNQVENLQRLQTLQRSEYKANLRSLQLETTSLKTQLERMESEFKNAGEKETQLMDELKNLQEENNSLKCSLQETTHKLKVENCTNRVELTKQKGEIERDRDTLVKKVEELKLELEVAQKSLDKQKLLLADQEKENHRKLLYLQQNEWSKINRLEKEKIELETKVEEIEQLNVNLEQEQKSALLNWAKEKEILETQLNKLKEKEHLRIDRNSLSVQSPQKEIDALVENWGIEVGSNQLKSERLLVEQQIMWEEQKFQLTSRISHLENQISQMQIKYSNENKTNRKKIKKYRQGIVKLRNRMQLQQAKFNELEAVCEVLKKNVPLEMHREIQKQLRQLQRKHDEFRNVMQSSEFSDSNLWRNQKWDSINQDDYAERELKQVNSRISVLGEKQKRQMVELDTKNN